MSTIHSLLVQLRDAIKLQDIYTKIVYTVHVL